jgi:hypothetical protein
MERLQEQKKTKTASSARATVSMDAMLKDAKIDGELMSSLGNSKISDQLLKASPTAESMALQKNTVKINNGCSTMEY